jgi:D-threo-aldose 1-dehydrogenase
MNYTSIGETGVKLPAVIFGTSALGNLYTEPDIQTKKAIVENCFTAMPSRPVVMDSAGKYGAGMALEVLGKCLEELNVEREDIVISNKLGWLQTELKTPEPTFEEGVWFGLKHDARQDISYEGILKCWEQGNTLLGGKYTPNLVSVHDPDEFIGSALDPDDREHRFVSVLEAYRALSELKAGGKVKAVGVGAKSWKIVEELANEVDFDWIMIANSLTILEHPPELCEFISQLQAKGIVVINSAVFNAGFLVGGRYFNYRPVDLADGTTCHLFEWRERFSRLCEKHMVSPSHACIRFGLSHPGISSVALNTSKPENIAKNVWQVTHPVSGEFFTDMKAEGLIDKDYKWV